MNSYPHEFLAHPQPLMFVAGLIDHTNVTSTSRSRAGSNASAAVGTTSRKPSGGSSSLLEPTSGGQANLAMTTPITSPSPQLQDLPSSPPVEVPLAPPDGAAKPSVNVTGGVDREVEERDREFDELVRNLRGALTPQSGKGKIWLPDRERKDFRIVLVDKAVRLPMRKVNPAASSQPSVADPPSTPHSPLSPLIPSSPLYPDGLIAPVWVRKHAELVPSVFVLFLRLYESKPYSGGGDESADELQAREAANRVMEKDQDDQLVREIGDRRRRLGERGIKLTVVLMASAATLDSPSLDPRLSYLRRASALSAKASLFVLTPVPADQLPDFVQSLQEALYDSATEYYSAHSKRVRRKRSRLPASQGLGQTKALGPQGWAVRYDWKAGWFAEVRGEFDVARRHYEDCWNELAKMFASTTMLPPRTKRWAEAKVLADCVAVRICKLLLYDDQASHVLSPFFVHLKRFGDLSRGWGIGDETFEYRIFAELLEMGQQSGGLRIPTPIPPSFPTVMSAAAPPLSADQMATPNSVTNPLQVLQHPAYYYYMAASCSLQRQAKFQEAVDAENEAQGVEGGSKAAHLAAAPGFANEKKVDHAALVIELFTKAYSLLKEQERVQNRMALFVAFRIAEVYCQSNQYDLALRFFDRISLGFKRERWSQIVRQIRKLWYECAQRTGNVETAARLLVEMMCPNSGVEGEDRAALQGDLLSLIKTTSPSSAEPVVVDLRGQGGLLDVRTAFWESRSFLSKPAPYQIVLRCPEEVDISEIAWNSLCISFSDGRPDVVVEGDGTVSPKQSDLVKIIDGVKAPLRWTQGRVIVLNGELESDVETEVRISDIRLSLKQGSWDLQLHFVPDELFEWRTTRGGFAPMQGLSSGVTFAPRPIEIDFVTTHNASGYVGEDILITVQATNNDDREISAVLSIFLQPSEHDDQDDGSTVTFDDRVSSNLLQDIPLGIITPSSSASRSFTLRCPVEGTKIIDLSLRSSLAAGFIGDKALSPEVGESTAPGSDEVNRTVAIPVLKPFDVRMAVKYDAMGDTAPEKSKLVTGDTRAVVGILVGVDGPRELTVESVELRETLRDDGEHLHTRQAKLVGSSLDGYDGFPRTWDQGTKFSLSAEFSLPNNGGVGANEAPHTPAELIFAWRSGPNQPLCTTVHPLPPLMPPTPTDSFLVPTIYTTRPAVLTPHEPFALTLSILNSHPTLTADSIYVAGETTESFVWLGERSSHLPPLAPGQTTTMTFKVVALGGSGWTNLPRIMVFEGEGEDREAVRVGGGGQILIRP
ncbi:hypothetical protein IAU60_002250 [Kwoniella sp. DSM 27419]